MLRLLAVVSKYQILMFLSVQTLANAHSKTDGGALRHNGDSVLLALASGCIIYGDGFGLEFLPEKHRVYEDSINAGFGL